MQLDETDWQILQTLQQEGRLSFSELGRRVGLSSPAATERVRKLEDAGIITGYCAQVNAEVLGLPLKAFIQLTTTPDRYPPAIATMEALPEILRSYHVTGDSSFVIEAIASSMSHLEAIINKLSQYGQTSTSIVLSNPVFKNRIEPSH
ncbi:Lrp/AsnC family transcriptional regulator [Spirulina sp. 06S082]|uniref:Lrp/AsnC family transcriptional regulator n=1 Tax=Spirulina sp. 06S082 TaxID=3110248 RepID=UPI002B21D64B|nr:Lrp/AsnC family transcriptional regulator [Spirulina sp. 06S082]MEA5471482.1 Lrp/AsnC family transcriptional regulator [Spirulina sp. 06S082]